MVIDYHLIALLCQAGRCCYVIDQLKQIDGFCLSSENTLTFYM